MYIISFTGYDPELYLLAWIIIASVSSSNSKAVGPLTLFRFCPLLALFRILSRAIWLLMKMGTSRLGKSICNVSVCRRVLRFSYEIFVFTVVPVGIMSFLTMVCSLAALYKLKH